MKGGENLIAIGRSRYLYDTIKHLASVGYSFKAIITDEAYEEYDIKHHDFNQLAHCLGARFFLTKMLCVDEIIQIIKEHQIRAGISANWKYTVPKKFLDLFEYGLLNFHLGNMPDYKGNATVNWAILNGEKSIYANVHKMDPQLDAGDVIAREPIVITEHSYITELLQQAGQMAPVLYEKALQRVLDDPGACELKGSVQGLRCYPRLPEDSQIDWGQSAEVIGRLIRASAFPYTGAYSFLDGEKVIIWRARPVPAQQPFLAVPGHVVAVNKNAGSIVVACKKGLLEIQEIEHRAKKDLPATLVKSIRVRFKFHANV